MQQVRREEPVTTVALIGASGFIGRHLTAVLQGQEVRVLDLGRLTPQRLPDVDALLDEHRPDAVVHLASNLLPGSGRDAFLDERAGLGCATLALADRLADRGTLLVYLSSGGAVYGPQGGPLLSEDSPRAPISYYGQAKLEIESYLDFARRSRGLRSLVVRPSNPYGPLQDPHAGQGLIAVVADRAMRGAQVEVWGDGSVVRDYVHVEDLARVVVHLVRTGVEGRAVNVGSGVGHSLLEVVDLVGRHLGVEVDLDFKPARPVDSPRAVLDVTAMRASGAPEPRSLDKGIGSYIEHLRGSRA